MARIPVLLIEDEPSDRMILAMAFQKVAPQIELRTIGDGDDAIGYLSGQGAYADRDKNPLPRLILCDTKLPKKSGLEVLAWIRQQQGLDAIPVLMLSSAIEKTDLAKARALGVTSYLVKSVDIKTMRETVRGIAESLQAP